MVALGQRLGRRQGSERDVGFRVRDAQQSGHQGQSLLATLNRRDVLCNGICASHSRGTLDPGMHRGTTETDCRQPCCRA
jgi:hypothetical protein